MMNYILDRLDFEEQIVRIIPIVENTSKHNYNESNIIKETARAMWLEQSKENDK